MLTIGIEINHVIRNINKQIIKYYSKEFDPNADIDDMDDKLNVFETYAKFKSKYEKNNFIYIDYPYEIFGCASTVEKKLPQKLTTWLTDISNIEDEDIRIVLFSLNEEALTIQSTFFFLSKIGTRVRKVFFPKSIDEVWDECDVVITTNGDFLSDGDKKVVLINRPFNEQFKENAILNYDNLSDIINDNNFFKKLKNDQ